MDFYRAAWNADAV